MTILTALGVETNTQLSNKDMPTQESQSSSSTSVNPVTHGFAGDTTLLTDQSSEPTLHNPGQKYDDGKPRCDLVLGSFSTALDYVARVGTYGATKYTDDGWLHVSQAFSRYSDAMIRHYLQEHSEDTHDEESGLPHAAHVAWNALARLELMLRMEKNGS